MAYDWTVPGGARRLSDTDLPREGHRIGVGEDEIHAFLDVEAAGRGFDAKGRPKMLFEPHIFYRELSGHQSARNAAVAAGLAYPNWRRNYPADSYPRLEHALDICRRFGAPAEAAFRSCSWGIGQIMGFNHDLAGYGSAEDMALAFRESEAVQLRGCIDFIANTGLDDELRRHDWRGFARGYNGSRYAENGYHTKLEDAFARWSRIRDTPWSPEDDAPEPAPAGRENQPGKAEPASSFWALAYQLIKGWRK